jgi:hypothetical protein
MVLNEPHTGDAVCKTASKGGSDTTALSKAPSWEMSSTITQSSLVLGTSGCAAKILSAFSWERTVVTTLWPRSSNVSRTCAAMKPLPPRSIRHYVVETTSS